VSYEIKQIELAGDESNQRLGSIATSPRSSFQSSVAATGNARSPTVTKGDERLIRTSVEAERMGVNDILG